MSSPVIQTYTGKLVNPFNMGEGDVCIEDIAHSLSMQCRFNGHTKRFYSVAEHSVYVTLVLKALKLPIKTQLLGLLHDASEAYLSDIPAPIKEYLPDYLAVEEKLTNSIYKELHPKFRYLAVNDFYYVDIIDREMCAVEGKKIMGGEVWDEISTEYVHENIISDKGFSVEQTKKLFLNLYNSLWKETANEQAASRAGNK